MSPYSIAVLALCLIGSSFAQNDAVRDVLEMYNECWNSAGLYPCLKVKALSLLDRTARMKKIELFNGITFTNTHVDNSPLVSEIEIEATLPRAIDAKSAALSQMIYDKASTILTSGNLEISMPTLAEEARKKGGDDDKFEKLTELLEGGGGKKKKHQPEKSLKDFLMDVMAHKLALTPLLIGGLFVLALKALSYAKIAFVITAIIWIKKLLASKGGNSGGHSKGGQSSGGWSSGGSSGWDAGSSGGWDRRSLEAQNLAYNAQKQD